MTSTDATDESQSAALANIYIVIIVIILIFVLVGIGIVSLTIIAVFWIKTTKTSPIGKLMNNTVNS